MPLTLDVVQAMAAVAFTRKRPQMAHALILAFAGLLRVGEVLQMKLGHFNFLNGNYLIITFPDSEGASRSGTPESIVIRDPDLISQLRSDFPARVAIHSCVRAPMARLRPNIMS